MLGACAAERPSAIYYAAYEAEMRAAGHLRTDVAPVDASYTSEDLAQNFFRVALHHETDISRVAGEDNWTPNRLSRWEGPLNYQLLGTAITDWDRARIRALMARVAHLTGLTVREVPKGGNFLIAVTVPGERDTFERELHREEPVLAGIFSIWRRSPQMFCVARTTTRRKFTGSINRALVVIGSETRGLNREACYHEEIIQALGLHNDHPLVRPSIFNDDDEFALLTEHDERLLRMLFDPRLAPGMPASEAMPIARQISSEIMNGATGVNAARGQWSPVPHTKSKKGN
ncbi:MAG: DUF2927 domain-containing protein [Paracoccaceae bacterium]|nr:DUF2927 domain-containing protein [Paracoccaceae bacterium]